MLARVIITKTSSTNTTCETKSTVSFNMKNGTESL